MENNRKKQIIDLTLKLIQEKGYAGFSYDDLSKQLGVTKASIHYHFEKKEDLGAAVCARLRQGLESAFAIVAAEDAPQEEKLWAFISARAEHLHLSEICPISALQSDYELLPAAIQQQVQKLSRMELEFLTGLLSGSAPAEPTVSGTEASSDLERNDEALAAEKQALAATFLFCMKAGLQYRRVLGDDMLLQVFNQLKRLL